MTRKQRRLTLIGSALAVLGLAAGLVLFAMRDSIVFFYGPTELVQKNIQPGTRLRIGGLVQQGSVQKGPDQTVAFAVTDTNKAVTVRYRGILPDLFREGQGIVAEGVLEPSGEFRADSVLAKHDETYMPKDVADALKKQGVWQHAPDKAEGAGATPAAAQGTKP
jgi:cytochrome c-type biogenesis protein CcmE